LALENGHSGTETFLIAKQFLIIPYKMSWD